MMSPMKKLLAIIVLSLCFMTLSQADDIRDFQIEGISIGDSVLDHSKIKNFQKFIPYKSKKYQGGFKKINSDIYDSLQFFYIKKDKNKTLENISGKKYFPNNIKECLKKKKKIENEVSKLFPNLKKKIVEKAHGADPSKKSMIYALNFNFPEGHIIQVSCTDWEKYKDRNGKMRNDKDELKVQLNTSSYVNFVRYEAWK
jgi:hypothetical protein